MIALLATTSLNFLATNQVFVKRCIAVSLVGAALLMSVAESGIGQVRLAQVEMSEEVEGIVPFTIEGILDANSEILKEDGSYYNAHTFEAQAGQRVSIKMVSDEFDTYLLLLSPDGSLLSQNDDGAGETNARIVATLPVMGIYTVVANSGAGETGNYVVTVQPTSVSNSNITSVDGLSEAEQLTQQMIQLYQAGRYSEALPLAQQALVIREDILGDTHPAVAQSLNNLAELYRVQGNYAAAEPLYQRSLTIWETALGDTHPAVAASLNNLALLYQAQGNYAAAEPLYQRSLSVRETVLGDTHPDVAQSLNNLAGLYQVQGNYAAAEPLYQRSLTIYEMALGDTHPDVAQSLNNLAGLYQVQGNYAAAEPLYQRSLTIYETALGDTHPDVAQSLNNLALLYQDQGNYAAAESLYQRSLTIYETALGDTHPDVAISLNNLAELYRIQGNYVVAEPLLQRSLTIYEMALGDTHPAVATTLNNLASLYQDQGNYVVAEPLYQRSLTIYETALGDTHPDVAQSLNNLASLYQAQGNYTAAEPLLQRSLTIFETAFGTTHPAVATSLNNLAELYKAQGNYAAAEPLLQRTLTIRETALGDTHPAVAESLNNLALLYQAQGNYTAAEPLLQRSLTIFETAFGTTHPAVATSLNNLAELHKVQRNYAAAEPLLQQSLIIMETTFGDTHPDVATSLNNLAGLYRAQGNYAVVEPLYQRSLTIRETALGNTHPDVAASLNNLASLYQAQGNYTAAEPLYQRSLTIWETAFGGTHPDVAGGLNNLASLYYVQDDMPRAIEFLQSGLVVEETNLTLMLAIGSEARKQAYINTLSGTTDKAISLHMQSATNSPDAARLALTTVLRRKGRILDAVTNSRQRLRQQLPPDEIPMLNQYTALQSQLVTLLYRGLEDQDPDVYRTRIDNLRQEIDRLENELAQRSAEFWVESKPIELETVQATIPEDAVLVELVQYRPLDPKALRGKRWGNPHYAAYTLTSAGEIKWADLGDAATIDQAADIFLSLLRQPIPRRQRIRTAGRTLDQLVMAPIRDLVGDANHLLISPDGQLNLIPFAALIDENDRYLIETYQITTLTSGRDLLKLQLDAPSRQSPVIIANPDFNAPGNPIPIEIASTSSSPTSENLVERSSDRRSTDLATLKFGPLPGTTREANAITPLLPNATLLTDTNASENALKSLNAPNILHIATHGFFLEDVQFVPPPLFLEDRGLGLEFFDNPNAMPRHDNRPISNENPLLRSGLALAGFNPRESGEEDGVLTALEASNLNLYGTELVILSACDTGVGVVSNGEGVYGLRRAFVMAGAESLMMSLWKVSDQGTADLMTRYYQHLQNGEGRSTALRKAQLEQLNTPGYEHPYYWASFIFSGDWTPLDSLQN